MNAPTAIDYAIEVLEKSRLMLDVDQAELNHQLSQLRAIRHNGVTPGQLYCPAPGCEYSCEAPAGLAPEEPAICPVHTGPLNVMTWKQLAGKVFLKGAAQAAEFDRQLHALTEIMDQSNARIAELEERMESLHFERGNFLDREEDLKAEAWHLREHLYKLVVIGHRYKPEAMEALVETLHVNLYDH